ncbi:MAG: PIG-L deacetylase family protein [Pirellulaceae bacterium]
MPEDALRLLVLGAHPDDAEVHAGGLVSFYRTAGHTVKIVSVTNGAAGHQTHTASALATVRRAEADAVQRLVGVEYDIWGFPDGELQPTLDVRHHIIREIRIFRPDLVLTHRTCDYHPDHRAVGQAVQDATYSVTVPLILPEVPALRRDPVVAYMIDLFKRPYPFQADVIYDVAPQLDSMIDLLDCHVSQVYEWLPYNMGIPGRVPRDAEERKGALRGWFSDRLRQVADQFREELIRTYGERWGKMVEFAEAYEISEYAAPLDETTRSRLFPFLP